MKRIFSLFIAVMTIILTAPPGSASNLDAAKNLKPETLEDFPKELEEIKSMDDSIKSQLIALIALEPYATDMSGDVQEMYIGYEAFIKVQAWDYRGANHENSDVGKLTAEFANSDNYTWAGSAIILGAGYWEEAVPYYYEVVFELSNAESSRWAVKSIVNIISMFGHIEGEPQEYAMLENQFHMNIQASFKDNYFGAEKIVFFSGFPSVRGIVAVTFSRGKPDFIIPFFDGTSDKRYNLARFKLPARYYNGLDAYVFDRFFSVEPVEFYADSGEYYLISSEEFKENYIIDIDGIYFETLYDSPDNLAMIKNLDKEIKIELREMGADIPDDFYIDYGAAYAVTYMDKKFIDRLSYYEKSFMESKNLGHYLYQLDVERGGRLFTVRIKKVQNVIVQWALKDIVEKDINEKSLPEAAIERLNKSGLRGDRIHITYSLNIGYAALVTNASRLNYFMSLNDISVEGNEKLLKEAVASENSGDSGIYKIRPVIAALKNTDMLSDIEKIKLDEGPAYASLNAEDVTPSQEPEKKTGYVAAIIIAALIIIAGALWIYKRRAAKKPEYDESMFAPKR